MDIPSFNGSAVDIKRIEAINEFAGKVKRYGKEVSLAGGAFIDWKLMKLKNDMQRIYWDTQTPLRVAQQYDNASIRQCCPETSRLVATVKRQKQEIDRKIEAIQRELKNARIETEGFVLRSRDLTEAGIRSLEQIYNELVDLQQKQQNF